MKTLSSRQFAEQLTRRLGSEPAQIFSRRRDSANSRIRHAIYCALRDQLRMTYPQIGGLMHRDHGAIIHGVKTVSGRLEVDPVYRAWWHNSVIPATRATLAQLHNQ